MKLGTTVFLALLTRMDGHMNRFCASPAKIKNDAKNTRFYEIIEHLCLNLTLSISVFPLK